MSGGDLRALSERAVGRLIRALDALLVAHQGDAQLDGQILWLGWAARHSTSCYRVIVLHDVTNACDT
jgi:hypothetical protein